MTIVQPTKFSHRKGRLIYSNWFRKNKPITRACVIKAAIKTEFPLTNLKKKASKNIPKTLP